ncbi:hypothetical protein L6452_17287 [Arctium lappa]|uniref:Uncharacterized protein n=1 Tax=Arctium lappa TaxID=4217 RepID=A0ACB9C324_ARCLA|nr:hypothetical protein L6452_17287 [Arctium lappa]
MTRRWWLMVITVVYGDNGGMRVGKNKGRRLVGGGGSFSLIFDSSSSSSNPNRFHFSNPKLMDFQSLNRRELQALCKFNKIPANMTNVAMADALKSLETVEGIEEILNSSRSESAGSSIESPEKIEITSPRVPRTSCRTSTRQKVKKIEESVPATASRTTGRGVRRQLVGEVNELKTPMVSSTRKKAPTTSCRNMGSQLNECEEVAKNDCLDHEKKCIPNTPVAIATHSRRKGTTALTHQDTVKKETAVHRVYSTRRSTRLTAKKSAEPGAMERERNEPVKIDSFLDEASVASEEDLGHLVPEKNVGSGSGSIEIPCESNISSEDTEDKVGEGSVEKCDVGVSKAKVEDICNAFEKLDVLVVDGSDQNLMIKKGLHVDGPLESEEEKVDCCSELDNNIEVKSVEIFEQGANMDSEETHNVGGKLVLNEANNSEEKDDQVDNLKPDTVLVPEEHSDSFFYDKASLSSEADDVDADAISFDIGNPNNPWMMKHEDTSFAVSETKNEIPEHNVDDVVLVDFVNHNEQEPNMDFESLAEEPQESLTEKTDVNVVPTIYGEFDLNSEQLNQEAEKTMDDADKISHESVADDSFIKEETQFPTKSTDHPMKKQTLSNGPTSISEVTSDNNENSEAAVQVVVVEENKSINGGAVDEKPKSLNEISMRKLKKQLKALSIKSNTITDKDDKVGEARPALQAVCDNQLITGEMEN